MDAQTKGKTTLETAYDLAVKLAAPNDLDAGAMTDYSIVMAGYAAVAQAEALTRIAAALEALASAAHGVDVKVSR